jgi:RNA polymerase sigma-70 factor (sigma-E family)
MDAESVRVEGTAFEELYVRYADGAFRLAFLITGDRHVAEDLTQDAFLRLAGRLLHLRNRTEFEWYLRRTVVNLANSNFRRRRVERRYLLTQSSMRQPEQATPDIAEHEALRQALMALPSRQRTALALRFYEDLSEAETAAVMGCRPGTVKSLVSKGKGNLQKLIGGEPDG